MSKSSTATAPKNPTPLPAKSAWARGPPQTATAPSPRSQSPVPSTPTHQTHSRRPSTLGQGIPVKDGVSVPRNNVGAVKQGSSPSTPTPIPPPVLNSQTLGSAVTFGSIDDVSAPISSSPAAAPSLKAEVVKSFGTVPATGHVNGKASISSRASVISPAASSSSSSAASPAAASSAAALTKSKIDIKKMFQNPTSAPSSNPPSDSSSPLQRNVTLPMQQSPLHQSQSNHTPHTPLGAHSFTPFVPSSMRPAQNSGPNGGPPRSPQYSRQMPNGNGPRSQGGQNGGPSAGLSSPRLGPHPHNGQPSQMPPPPQMQPQMQPQMHQMGMPWPGYYSYPAPDQQHYMYSPQWYPPPMPMQQPHGQHQPPTPGQHLPPHGGMPMSPRNPPSSLQAPGTPILSQALPNPVHAPHQPPVLSHPSNSIGGLTSPPPTPSSASIPNRLNATSSAFVPRTRVTLKKEDGTEVTLENLKSTPGPAPTTTTSTPQGSAYRQGSPGTPTRRPASIRIESEDQRKLRLAEEEQKEKEKARVKAEAEEKVRKEKEEVERKAKEAEEKKRKEEEAEKQRIRKEEEEKEAERLRKEEEERTRKEAEEREAQRVKEEEERKRKEVEVAEARRIEEEKAKKEAEERAEKERVEKEKAEQARLAKEAEEEKIRLEQEEAAKLAKARQPEPEAELDGKSESTVEEGEVVEDGKDAEVSAASSKDDGKDKVKESLRINTGPTSPTMDRRQRPGPLDLTNAKASNIPAPQTALATARIISDITSVQYPEGVSSPRPDLNENAKEGKFRYDRDFLLQFMSICKEKPAMLPPLDAIGLEPADQSQHAMTRTQSGRRAGGPGGAPASRQSSIGLGFAPGTFNKGPAGSFSMGNFATVGASKLSSQERFEAARPVSVSGAPGMQYTARPTPVQRTTSQGGPGSALRNDRTRSKRGEKRGENNKATGGQGGGGGQQSHGGGYNNYQQQQQMNLEPVAPLQASANRWDRKAIQIDADSPEMVDRKVKGLLNKLTMEKFDSISDQIISWANKSEKEKDGRTLIQVIRLVFEKATDEATWSEMYARLCRKMMEQISPKVQDDGIKNNEGKPIAGGQLFRKYLLNRCQEDFERGWVAKEATAAAAASKALEDQAVKAANDKGKEDGKEEEVVLYSEEYYAAQKAKRQGLGLIKFIGELFKLQMLTERIMHECVKKLLGNVDNPEEEEIESLCKLLGTVGGILDTPKARAHLDVYFARMKELTKSANVTPRMQYMLQDLVELRERKWVTRNTVAAPTTIAQIHETAAKEKAAAEKESYQRQISMSRGGSRRGGDRNDFNQVNPDGWAVAGGGSGPPRPPPKAGDLSNFGKISKAAPMTFGPSSVFAGKKGAESKRESISRTSSSSNMFSMLSAQGAESGEAAAKAAEPTQRRRLVLQPRSKPVDSESGDAEHASPAAGSESGSDDEEAAEAEVEMTEAEATKKIKEDLKEFFAVRNLEEAEVYFKIPAQYHHVLVDKLVSHAVESKEADAKLVSDFFEIAASKELCSAQAFEDGFMPISELIDDIAIDAPKAFQLFALMVKGAKLNEDRRNRLASKSIDSDKLLALLQ